MKIREIRGRQYNEQVQSSRIRHSHQQNNEVLLSSELRFEKPMIKFPGGGLEFGEGLVDCLKREFQEECGIEVEVGELFYVNDFVQVSAFNSDQQLISFITK